MVCQVAPPWVAIGEVGHRDLWEAILRESGGGGVQLRWVPSHLNIHGNNGADTLASLGRRLHPYYLFPLSKRRRVTEWDQLGLEPMAESVQPSNPDSALDSKSEGEGMGSSSSSESDSDGFSTDVNDRAQERVQALCSLAVWETNTDFSDSR